MTTTKKNGIGRFGAKGRAAEHEDLVALPFADFARRVADLLSRMGYEDVRLVGRATGGGRNGEGGYDLLCFIRQGAVRRKVIVLLKQFGRNAWVYQRMVDELRGVALRDGADEAILITSGPISPVVEICEGPGRILPRVRRIDGERLRRLLAANGPQSGVSTNSPTVPPRIPSPASGGRGSRYRWSLGGAAASGETSVTVTLTVRS
ncbi:MAG: restriction endonuclease [Armatimonadota bacterium]